MAVTLTSYAPFASGAGADVEEDMWRNFMKHVLDTGPLSKVLNEFELYADSSGMQVKVRTGEAWIQGHWGKKDTETILPIDANSSGVTRTDRSILRCDFVNDRIELDILKGTPGVLALTQNTSMWEIALGQIAVANGAVTIAAGNITNERVLVTSGGRQRLGAITPAGDIAVTNVDTMRDTLTFNANSSDKIEMHYSSGFSLNTTGRLSLIPRAASGSTVTTASTPIQGTRFVPGDGGSCSFDFTYEWTAPSTGQFTIGISVAALAGAGTGTIYGTTDGRGRFMRIKRVPD